MLGHSAREAMQDMGSVRCKVRRYGDVAVVYLLDDAYRAAAEEELFQALGNTLKENASALLVIDLTAVGIVGSGPMCAIMATKSDGAELGCRVVLSGLNEDISELYEIMEIEGEGLPRYQDVEAAIADFSAEAAKVYEMEK